LGCIFADLHIIAIKRVSNYISHTTKTLPITAACLRRNSSGGLSPASSPGHLTRVSRSKVRCGLGRRHGHRRYVDALRRNVMSVSWSCVVSDLGDCQLTRQLPSKVTMYEPCGYPTGRFATMIPDTAYNSMANRQKSNHPTRVPPESTCLLAVVCGHDWKAGAKCRGAWGSSWSNCCLKGG
jgi:hypothetical protein